MIYATRDDLAARFGEDELVALTTGRAAGTADEERLHLALRDASAEIDAYLAARYPVPLNTRPALLTGIAADLARYRLYDEAASETVRQKYEDAQALLKAIARGEVWIGTAPPVAPPPLTARPAPAVAARALCLTDALFARASPLGEVCGPCGPRR